MRAGLARWRRNGFGVMCVGHANPTIAAAVKARMDEGPHFAATEGSIVVGEELRRRWGLAVIGMSR